LRDFRNDIKDDRVQVAGNTFIDVFSLMSIVDDEHEAHKGKCIAET
jgi:hypothetical protein